MAQNELNIRLFLPILARLSDAKPGYYTTDARVNLAISPFPGIPEKKIFVVDMNSEYILTINNDEQLSVDLKNKEAAIHVGPDGVSGYARLADMAEGFAKFVYEAVAELKSDRNVDLMIKNYEADPDFNKNYNQIFKDWIHKNISDLFAKTSSALDNTSPNSSFLQSRLNLRNNFLYPSKRLLSLLLVIQKI